MRKALLLFLVLALVPALAVLATGDEGGFKTYKLKFQPLKKWDYWTPNPDSITVGSGAVYFLPLPGKGGKIRVEFRSDGIWADSNGDAVVDVRDQRGFLTVPLRYKGGKKGYYTVLFRKEANGWSYSRFCVMTGKVNGVRVTLVDENHNGIYGEIGKDTWMIGREDTASYVSRITNIGGNLYRAAVDPSGSEITLEPYEGPSGILDLASKYDLRGKVRSRLRMAMVKTGKDVYFNLAEKGKKYRIPAGKYTFVLGLVGSGKLQMADILPGRLPEFEVKADEVTTHRWGAAGDIKFDAVNDEGNITIETTSIEIFGKGGEKYMNFRPTVFTPRVQVREIRSKKLLVNKSMGAGC